MVYWKSNRSAERLLSAIFAAHPNLKLDSHAIALCYGEGASHIAIENRIRLHRKEGEKLQDEAGSVDGHSTPTGRYAALTPRTPRNRSNRESKSKTKSSSHKMSRRLDGYPPLSDSEVSEQETPSKKPKVMKTKKSGSTLQDPISLVGSEGSPDDNGSGASEEGAVRFKKEKAGDEEDAQVVGGGPAIKKEHRCTPAPAPASGSSRQSLHRLPSLPAILSQSRVNSQSCAYTDGRAVRDEWKGDARGRTASTEKTKAYASRDGSVVYLG
ncbi:hypothetical protein PHISP_01238 [Aspergillus sp. HF37]|nr:hypothetical protein PHISP_01238 [Aspergillus sp. HF37]